MMKRLFLYLIAALSSLLAACSEDESFSTSQNDKLAFSVEEVLMDTVFTTVPSATYTFWVYNRNNDGLRLKQVRLERGNQSGFRVNVDGTFLSQTAGYQVANLEVRRRDSLRVFVELTAAENYATEAQPVEDNLVFLLENGIEQKVPLKCYAWDAVKMENAVITSDVTIESEKPVVIYGSLTVAEGATLTVRNTKIYFHAGAGLDVYGTLKTEADDGKQVVLRGDRLDHMFDYLPYDRVSGQWRGVHFYATSTGNELTRTEIRNAENGVVCDEGDIVQGELRLLMNQCVVHNSKGCGVETHNALVAFYGCQFTNALGDCLAVYGGGAEIDHCTMAQFYPFSADRGMALHISSTFDDAECPLYYCYCRNSIVTGYDDDVLLGEHSDNEEAVFMYYFEHCLLRTPVVEESADVLVDILWESPKDEVQGKQHFVKIDEDNLDYDFHLSDSSPLYGTGLGCYADEQQADR